VKILYHSDANGNITHYQVYGADSSPVMRVDITGRPYGGTPTPHVVGTLAKMKAASM
jgi:hypothetical protein